MKWMVVKAYQKCIYAKRKNFEIASEFNGVVTSEKKTLHISCKLNQLLSVSQSQPQSHSKQKRQHLLNFNVSKKISIISNASLTVYEKNIMQN